MSALGDDALLHSLKRLWDARDPMPADLDDGVMAVLSAHMIVTAASLSLISDESRLLGVRSAQDARTLTFSDGTVEVVVRLVADGEGTRVDGWAVPVAQGVVTLRSQSRVRTAVVDENGRFAFVGVPGGPAEMWFEPSPLTAGTQPWRAPDFTIPELEE